MDGGVERGLAWLRACERVQVEFRDLDFGGNIGRGAEMREVGREAVGEIDARGGEAAAEDRLADGEAWLRKEVRMVRCGRLSLRGGFGGVALRGRSGEGREFGGGASQGSADEDAVAGLSAG